MGDGCFSVVQNEELFKGTWLTVQRVHYRDPLNKMHDWERVERVGHGTTSKVDGVDILAVLRESGKPSRLVLVSQYRAATGGTCLEFPAGLCDGSESPEETALRELKEETGYVGEVVNESIPTLFINPSTSNEDIKLVHVEIDGSSPENQNPTPTPEDDEFIRVHLVPITQLLTTLTGAYGGSHRRGHS